jgi:hypothetical protein
MYLSVERDDENYCRTRKSPAAQETSYRKGRGWGFVETGYWSRGMSRFFKRAYRRVRERPDSWRAVWITNIYIKSQEGQSSGMERFLSFKARNSSQVGMKRVRIDWFLTAPGDFVLLQKGIKTGLGQTGQTAGLGDVVFGKGHQVL